MARAAKYRVPEAGLPELEAKLQQFEAMYRFAPVGLCLIDAELRFVHLNERMAAINGSTVAKHIGRRVEQVIPAIADQVLPVYRRVLETGEPVCDLEVHGTLPSDPRRAHVWLVNSHPVRADDGQVSGIVTVVLDITERRRAEEELAAVKERLAEAQRVAGIGSWEWDILEDQVWWSDELYKLMRKEKSRFVPSFDAVFEAVHPDDRPDFRRQLDATLQQDLPYVLEFRVVLDDGDVRTFHTSAALVRNADGLPARLIGTARDITEERRLEAQR